MKRFIVVLGLFLKNRGEKADFGRSVLSALNTSTYFTPVQKTDLETILTGPTETLEAANAAAEKGDHDLVAAAETAEFNFDIAMRNAGGVVQVKADANLPIGKEIITSVAMKYKSERNKRPVPSPIDTLEAKVTGLGTSIALQIGSENPYGTVFEIQMSLTPDRVETFVTIAEITAKKFVAGNLVNGSRYYFQVRAKNSKGASIYSSVVSQLAA